MSEPPSLAYPEPPLCDGVVRLRRWEKTDLACIRAASDDEHIPEGTTVPRVYSEPEGLAFIERQWGRLDDGEGLSLAITDAPTEVAHGAVVLLFRPQHGTVGVGYWVIETARGRSLASRAVRLLTHWALTETEIARIEALVEPGNEPSCRVLERAGFQREGLLRSYLAFPDRRGDALIYSLLASDLSGPDAELR